MADTQSNDPNLSHPREPDAHPEPVAATPEPHPTDETEPTQDELPVGQMWTPTEDPPAPPPMVHDEAIDPADDALNHNPDVDRDSDEGVSEFLVEVSNEDAVADQTANAEGAETTASLAPTAVRLVKAEKRPRDTVMIVNDAPGDECRIAFARARRLESYFAERSGSATNVGNIYKGRVTNVEAAIQAAFIDFGEGQNGFLHISDVHPKYFPGGEKAERVGHKIPRRERPPIQECLKKGQEVLVQVIKQGIGTKGPTVTSYLSIPGRLLVMMPDMDKVGVSRKVEDETQRREMRRILDSLELPEGCGFILRTAGFDRSRTELQRDAAYLTRLWQAMTHRIESVGAPSELYTESDVLIRTVREMVDDTISDIIVDSENAWSRVTAFLDVVFPKDAPRVLFYDRSAPIFTAFDLERQISDIYQRQVTLPSGGALVFDQTEALVSIDVNSGKSRSARDSETNAFETNKEAVDEICRQLRLRDMGGLVVCDLIDMRSMRHRRDIEERFRTNLRKDRAKSTVTNISEFGLVELTRQRMRPSVRKAHFHECAHCAGSGEVRIPDSTASEALRRVMTLLGSDRVHRVEMVCSVRVASVLLSSRRDQLIEIERETGKRIDVRISEAIAADRVDLYAYDDQNADVEIDRLPPAPIPRIDDLPEEPPEETPEAVVEVGETAEPRARRRRRRKKTQPADATAMLLSGAFDDLPEVSDDEPSVMVALQRQEVLERASREAERKARDAERRAAGEVVASDDHGSPAEPGVSPPQGSDGRGGRNQGRNRGRGRGRQRAQDPSAPSQSPEPNAEGSTPGASETSPGPDESGNNGAPRRRRRRGGRGRNRHSGTEGNQPTPEGQSAPSAPQNNDPAHQSNNSADESQHAQSGDPTQRADGAGNQEGHARRRRRRGGRNRGGRSNAQGEGGSQAGGSQRNPNQGSGRRSDSDGSSKPSATPPASNASAGDGTKPKSMFRSLYGAAMRRLSPGSARDALKRNP